MVSTLVGVSLPAIMDCALLAIAFINSVGKQPVGALDERIVFDKILINKELASVWTPYQLYVKDKYIHQGVNSFQVIRTKDGWKIQYLIDTRYP